MRNLIQIYFLFFHIFPLCLSLSLSLCLSVCLSVCLSLCLSLKKLYGPFLWMGFNCLMARATSRRQFTFYFFSVSLSLSFFLSIFYYIFIFTGKACVTQNYDYWTLSLEKFTWNLRWHLGRKPKQTFVQICNI